MSTYKRKRINWIIENFDKEVTRLAKLANIMSQKYQDASEEELEQSKEVNEGYDIFDPVVEEIRDEYLVSEPIARKLLVDCIRLRRRGKI